MGKARITHGQTDIFLDTRNNRGDNFIILALTVLQFTTVPRERNIRKADRAK